MVLVAVAFAAAAPPVPARGASESSLGGFQVSTTASAVQIFPSLPGFTVTDPPFRVDVPYTVATLASGPRSFARASLVWPGDLLAGLGTLMGQAGAPPGAVPNYPLFVEAASPDGTARLDPAPGATMRADASERGSAARAGVGVADVPGVVRIGSITSTSATSLEAGRAAGESLTTMHDVVIADGAVRIGTLQTTARAASDGVKGVSAGSVVIAGLRVLGTEVELPSGPQAAGELPGPVADSLAAAGISVRILGSEEQPGGAGVTRMTGGVLVTLALPDNPVQPASLHIALGVTAAAANASPAAGAGGDKGPGGDVSGGAHEPAPDLGPLPPSMVARFPVGVGPAVLPPPARIGPGALDGGAARPAYAFGGTPGTLVAGVLAGAALVAGRLRRTIYRLFSSVR